MQANDHIRERSLPLFEMLYTALILTNINYILQMDYLWKQTINKLERKKISYSFTFGLRLLTLSCFMVSALLALMLNTDTQNSKENNDHSERCFNWRALGLSNQDVHIVQISLSDMFMLLALHIFLNVNPKDLFITHRCM